MSTIEVGKWFNLQGYVLDTFGVAPKICTKVNKTRVYYKRWCEDEGQIREEAESFCSISSVGFVCDTLEELKAIIKLGLEQHEAIKLARQSIKMDYRERLLALRKTFKPEVKT